MKIHTIVRDAQRMEMSELEAINRRVRAVQATPQPNEPERTESIPEPETEIIEKAEEKVEVPSPARKKKKKENV